MQYAIIIIYLNVTTSHAQQLGGKINYTFECTISISTSNNNIMNLLLHHRPAMFMVLRLELSSYIIVFIKIISLCIIKTDKSCILCIFIEGKKSISI